jgi:hydrogenase-4 component B
MRGPMMVLALACIAIGLVPSLFWPAVVRAASVWNPAWSRLAVLPSLKVLGDFHVMLALAVVVAAASLWQVTRQNGLRRALTWDCGYAAPSSRMQYTAGSFAAIVTGWFAWILRPVTHEQRPNETFAACASFEEHTPETVLERVIVPSGNGVLHLATAARRLQHGRAQSYILYLAGAITALSFAAFV